MRYFKAYADWEIGATRTPSARYFKAYADWEIGATGLQTCAKFGHYSSMPAPDPVHRLVERYHEHRDAYRAGNYNETQVRREFIDPLFAELGWDVGNKQGYAEQYKDVVHEDAVKIGGSTKAPDYSFRIGGVRKFFLEAKKPSVDVGKDPAPAYQLRRYAWSAKLPLSVNRIPFRLLCG